MFETYLGLTNRDAKNASLLEKYQPDIDALCERFSKEGLLNLMTVTDQNNDRQMKPASGIVDVISSLAENSNQISFFQDVAILKEWCTQQSREFYQLALKIYADESEYQNRIPGRVIRRIKKFIDRGWANDHIPHPLLRSFLNVLDDMQDPHTFHDYPDNKTGINTFNKFVEEHPKAVTEYLTSEIWLNSIPKDLLLKAKSRNERENVGMCNKCKEREERMRVSWLVFSIFCAKNYFHLIISTLDSMQRKDIICTTKLHHHKMIPLITLAILPYIVMVPVISKNQYNITITCPDEFIVKNVIPFGKANLTGYKKDTEQLFRKLYIYIALLINPKWAPTANELISFLEGSNEKITGSLNFKSTSRNRNSKTNNISSLGRTKYTKKLLERAKNK